MFTRSSCNMWVYIPSTLHSTPSTLRYKQNYPDLYKYFHQNFGFDGQMNSEVSLFSNP